MRWPSGPPHLTLKNPPKKTKKNKKTKKKKKKKNTHTQKKQKNNIQLSAIFLFVFGGCPKIIFDLAKKRAPNKHYKIGGFSKAFFEKQICVTKRPFSDKKIPNPEISVIIFFCLFLLFQQQKTPKLASISIL